MPDYEITSPEGKKFRVTAPEGATQEQVMSYAKQQFAQQRQQQFSMEPKEGPNTWGQAAKNVAQGAGHLGTSIVGGLVGDVAGLGAAAYDITANAALHPFSGSDPGGYADPAAVRDRVANFLTYTPENKDTLTMKAVQAPGVAIGGTGQALDDAVTSATGNTYLGRVAGAGPLALANFMGLKAARGPMVRVPETARTPTIAGSQPAKIAVPEPVAPALIPGKTPEERAKNYVGSRTNLDWNTLSAAFRKQLTDIATSAGRLERLDGTAVERQGLLASLERPITTATRGTLTRNPLQQRAEQLVKATEEGAPLRDLDIQHNRQLIDNLDVLRGRTGGKATGDLQTGRSVQEPLRQRLEAANKNVSRLYKDAEAAGEAQGPVNVDSLVDYLKNHDNPPAVAFALQRLKQLGVIVEETNGGISVSRNRPLTFKELEGIRKAANVQSKSADGTIRHYAGEVKDVIDDAAANAGGPAGEAYAAARAARKAVGDEFERKGAIARLVKNRRMSADRAVALEDTWRNVVLTGSYEEMLDVLSSLKKSLGGKQAVADLKAATVDYIKNKATGGKLGLKNESGDLNAGWGAMKRAVDDIGPDKLKQLLGAEDAAKLTKIVDAAQILKTEAPTGIKGSPTFDKALTFLDRLSRVPGLETAANATKLGVRGAAGIKDMGKAGREIRHATTSPLEKP